MKNLLFVLLLVFTANVFSQNKTVNLGEGPTAYDVMYGRVPDNEKKSVNQVNTSVNTGYDAEATNLLYKEVDFYRERKGLGKCAVTQRTVKYAKQWGAYMMDKHNTASDNFYKHSKFGPEEYHIPTNTSEIIHLLYFDHRPSAVEITAGLMYGISRGSNSVIGWVSSPGHNECLLQNIVFYYGASVYVEKRDGWYVVYGTVNFSTER
jgi:uncharacterized protein YkwD